MSHYPRADTNSSVQRFDCDRDSGIDLRSVATSTECLRLGCDHRPTPSKMLDELDNVFDDHPSLEASLEDYESNTELRRSPMFGLPSQHSGFRSDESDEEEDEIEDPAQERWSPPGFQHEYAKGSGWYRHQPYERHVDSYLKPTIRLSVSPSQSREASPQYEDAPESPVKKIDSAIPGDISVAANVPLPAVEDTPLNGRSPSPPPAPSSDRTVRQSPDDDGFGPENLSNCRPCLI